MKIIHSHTFQKYFTKKLCLFYTKQFWGDAMPPVSRTTAKGKLTKPRGKTAMPFWSTTTPLWSATMAVWKRAMVFRSRAMGRGKPLWQVSVFRKGFGQQHNPIYHYFQQKL